MGSRSRYRRLEHLADRIDQKPERFALCFDADRHRRRAVVALLHVEPAAHVDCRYDAAAQIEHAGDLGPASGTRVMRDGLEHVLDARDRQAEHLAGDGERDELGELGCRSASGSAVTPPDAGRRSAP